MIEHSEGSGVGELKRHLLLGHRSEKNSFRDQITPCPRSLETQTFTGIAYQEIRFFLLLISGCLINSPDNERIALKVILKQAWK